MDANEGDRGRFSELSLTLLLKNKLILLLHKTLFDRNFRAIYSIDTTCDSEHFALYKSTKFILEVNDSIE